MATAREKRLAIARGFESGVIRSDFILLERILLNLVSNAVRYTDEVESWSAAGAAWAATHRCLRQRHRHPGGSTPQFFSEFYQLDGGEKDRHGGLGLGLAIVDRLCGLLDHPIELISSVGRGSRFLVLVPSAPPRGDGASRLDAPRALADSEQWQARHW